jgi:hypothetical protein
MASLVEMALAGQTKGPTCRTGEWLTEITKAERAEVEAALADARVQHASLWRAVKARWPKAPGPDSFTRHRKQECACGSR